MYTFELLKIQSVNTMCHKSLHIFPDHDRSANCSITVAWKGNDAMLST